MRIECAKVPERLQRRIAADEQVLWCGKGRPVVRFVGYISDCIAGVILLGILSFFGFTFTPIVFSENVSICGMILFAAFFLCFGSICVYLLFSPFWHWLGTSHTVWVITDKRVLRLCYGSCREWKDDELLDRPNWVCLPDGGRNFAFGQHKVSSKHNTHWEHDIIESVPAEDVAVVEAALVRLSVLRKERQAVKLTEQMANVLNRFTVLRGADGCVRIIYRKTRAIFGGFMLAFVLNFVAFLIAVFANDGDVTIPIILAFVPMTFVAGFPFVYEIFGRREICIKDGKGYYFNGVGRLGIRRAFAYDKSTLVYKGIADYQAGGRDVPAVRVRSGDGATDRLILAHSEEAVVQQFILLLRSAI